MSAETDKGQDGSLFSEVADVVGAEAAEKLMGALGGQQIVVSEKPSDKMAALLGEDAATRLCDEFAGIRVYVPVKMPLDRAARNRKIVKARAAGMDYAAIAKAHGVTVRTVFYVLARG